MASRSSGLSSFFLPGERIEENIITRDICWYLGADAVVRPGTYSNPVTRRTQLGYYIKACRPLTSSMVADLRSDSQKWLNEKAIKSEISRVLPDSYTYSDKLSDSPDTSVPSEDYYNTRKSLKQTYSSMSLHSPQSFYSSYPPNSDFQQPENMPVYSQPFDKRFTPIRSQSDPIRSGGGNIRDIRLIHPTTGHSLNAVALLDTGCITDNWVSRQTVATLRAVDLIDSKAPIKTLQAANMSAVQSKGAIDLDWRWFPKGIKVHRARFNVADASHYDVIIGNEYIEENGLHKWIEDAFSPLTEHDPVISPYEAEAIRQAKEKQQQDKANREAAKSNKKKHRHK